MTTDSTAPVGSGHTESIPHALIARADALPDGPERDAAFAEAIAAWDRKAAEHVEAAKARQREEKRERAKPKESTPKAKPKTAHDAEATKEAIDKLNARYFIVDVGSETVVGEEVAHFDMRTSRHWSTYTFRSFADFKKKLIKHRVLIGEKRAPLADVWLGAISGTQYEGLVYAPPGANAPRKNDLNGWKGFTTEPKPGDWPKTAAFIKDVVCDGDAELNEWVLDWIAALFQQPGRHGETALVLVGPEGIGKNVFAETLLGHTFDGRHFRITPHTNQVLGEFNDTLSGCCLLVLDEAELMSKKDAGHARSLITAHTVPINRKGIALTNEDSMLHWVFLTNNERNPTGYMAAEDRRYVVMRLSDKHRNDDAYFKELTEALERGERAAFLDAMITREITRNLRLAPRTAAKDKVKRASWAPVFHFLLHTMRELGREDWNGGSSLRGEAAKPEKPAEDARPGEAGLGDDEHVKCYREHYEGLLKRYEESMKAEAKRSRRPREIRDENGKHIDGQRLDKVGLAGALSSYQQEHRISDLDPQNTLHEAFRKMWPDDSKTTWNRRVRSDDGKTGRSAWTLPAWDEMRTALARAVGVEPEALDLDDEGSDDNVSGY